MADLLKLVEDPRVTVRRAGAPDAEGTCVVLLECLPRVQQDGHRALVDEFYLHHFLKTPGFADESRGKHLDYEELIELTCFFCRRSGIERRAIAAPDVGIKCELRDGQHAAADVQYAAVHLSGIVFENAQAGDFSYQVAGIVLRIVAANAKQDQQSQPDLAGDFFVDRDLGAAYPLDDGTHVV